MKLSHVTFVWLAILCVMSHNQIEAVHCVDFEAQPENSETAIEIKLDSKITLDQFKENNKELLQADLKVAEILGWTDLHLAALWGFTDKLAHLIEEYSFDLDVRDKNGQTPLHLAAARGKTKCIQLLLDNKADSNAQDKNGCTPLHIAYFHMHSINHPSITLLANELAFTTIKNNEGKTPLEIRSLVNEHSWR